MSENAIGNKSTEFIRKKVGIRNLLPKKPKYYDTLENLWRQPSEHAKANKSKIESV